MRNRRFTLVELLVIIAIIVILAAMMMPALQGALNTSRTTLCANNQLQLYNAFIRYVDSRNGFLPRVSSFWWNGSTGNVQSWLQIMSEELYPAVVRPNATAYRCETGQFLSCPAVPAPVSNLGFGTYLGSYGMNPYGIGTAYIWIGVQPRRYLRLRDVPHPARQIAFGDSLGFSYPSMTEVKSGMPGRPEAVYFPGYDARVCFPHGGNRATNALFVDGHVKTAGVEILKPESSALNGLFSSPPWGSP